MKNKRLILIIAFVVILLLIPLIAMIFTDEMNWSPFDFIVAGVLLFGTGLTIEFILRKVTSTKLRLIIVLAVLLFLFLIWVELAVGIFGSPLGGT